MVMSDSEHDRILQLNMEQSIFDSSRTLVKKHNKYLSSDSIITL